MLKRLLTAVLVLGLILAFSGTAFTAPNNVPGDVKAHKLPAYTGQLPSKAVALDKPTLKRAVLGVPDNTGNPPMPAPAGVDTAQCNEWDYYSDGAGAYRVDMYDATGPYATDDIAMKFDVVNYPTYKAYIDVVYGIIRFASHKSGGGTGPGLKVRVQIWDDVLGKPGTLISSSSYTLPSRVTAAAWYSFTLPSTVVVNGPYFHVSLGYDPSTAAVGDSLSFRMSNAPTSGRATYGSAGAWYAMPDAFGADYDWAIVPHSCEHYTSCFTQLPNLGTGSGYICRFRIRPVGQAEPRWADSASVSSLPVRKRCRRSSS